jgi:HSP20 family protein
MQFLSLRSKPQNQLSRLNNEINDLFSRFFGDSDKPFYDNTLWPAIDIHQDENNVTINAEVPGCEPDDIDISISDNTLTITGEKKLESEKKEKGYYHLERTYGNFRRELTLPSDIDTEKIDASCKNGVLSITLPKTEKAKPLKVKVKGQ